MSTIEIGELKSKLTNESVVNAQLLKKISELEWQIVRLKAGHAAISEVRCNAIVESEKDTKRLDWINDNRPLLDRWCNQFFVGGGFTREGHQDIREAIDVAMKKEAKP